MNSYIKYRNKRWRPKPQLSFSVRKAKRQPYTGSKRFDRTCRNQGACGHCSEGRQHAKARQTPIAEWELVGFEDLLAWEASDKVGYRWLDDECCDEWDYNDWDDDPWDMWYPYDIEDWHRNELSDPWEDYRNCIEWEDPNSWMWEFNGLEDDYIMEIIDNRLNTSEVI